MCKCVYPCLVLQRWELREELIRDRLLEGINDNRLSERLEVDPELNLGEAVAITRQSELVHQQQRSLREGEKGRVTINAVKTSKRSVE